MKSNNKIYCYYGQFLSLSPTFSLSDCMTITLPYIDIFLAHFFPFHLILLQFVMLTLSLSLPFDLTLFLKEIPHSVVLGGMVGGEEFRCHFLQFYIKLECSSITLSLKNEIRLMPTELPSFQGPFIHLDKHMDF